MRLRCLPQCCSSLPTCAHTCRQAALAGVALLSWAVGDGQRLVSECTLSMARALGWQPRTCSHPCCRCSASMVPYTWCALTLLDFPRMLPLPQEKCEPPVYVSDRRLVKAVALMQVGA